MANLKEVRIRINSVKTTQQITKAMKLVAASKLKRAQDRITQMRPYADKLYDMLGNLMDEMDGDVSISYNKERPIKNVLIVVLTSDKGLCGGFNATTLKNARRIIEEKYSSQAASGNLHILTIGKKGNDFFRRMKYQLNSDYYNLLKELSFEKSSEVAEFVMNGFNQGQFDVVEVVYAKFKNAGTQLYTSEQFLPLPKLEVKAGAKKAKNNYIFEPAKAKLIEELVPKILKTQFFRYALDSNASEHGARMIAMDKATDNANELLNGLKLMYNRERQAAITKEILEIVGGAAALAES